MPAARTRELHYQYLFTPDLRPFLFIRINQATGKKRSGPMTAEYSGCHSSSAIRRVDTDSARKRVSR